MRRISSFVASVLLTGLVAVGAGSDEGRTEEVMLDIDGMTCDSCAASIAATLTELEGVAKAAADFAAAEARVSYDPAVTSPDDLAAAVRALGYGARVRGTATRAEGDELSAAASGPGEACSSAPTVQDSPPSSKLSQEEVDRVVDYIVTQLLATGRTAFDSETLRESTGVTLGPEDSPVIQKAVVAKLSASEVGRQAMATSRCQAYDACSLYGDLSGASGEILAMYEREKAEDGRVYADSRLPDFKAKDLTGRDVSAADLLGRQVLLAFVAVHCRHSIDSLPILQSLAETYRPDGLRVVAVAINSGTVEDVNTWFPTFNPTYEVWVSAGDSLGDLIGSHLVPTYLLVDSAGRITEKLVGYKEPAAVTERVLERLVADRRSYSQDTSSR